MKPIVKNIVLPVFCLTVALLSTGCAGMFIRSSLTDSATYQAINAKSPPHSVHARVWVYAVGGGPNAWNTMGTQSLITFQSKAYHFGGDTFLHLDLPPGETRVTTTGVESGGPFSLRHGPGKIRKQIVLESGKEYFIRIQSPDNGPSLTPYYFGKNK